MVWRSWSVIAVLLLANYLVFSALAMFVFPPTPFAGPTHAAQPTFTPGNVELHEVGTLTYDFLLPTATATETPTLTPTLTLTPTQTIPATGPARRTPSAPATSTRAP